MGDEQLIDIVKRYEVIYNTKCNEYRDPTLRNTAWVEIANLHGKSVDQCKETWTKLRNCYNNAIKRRKKKNGHPFAPWRYDEQMSFLKSYLGERPTGQTAASNLEIIYAEDSSESTSFHEELRDPENGRPTTPTSKSSFKRKASPEDTCLYEMIDHEERPQEMSYYCNEKMDGTDHFFLSMSKMVKTLPRIDQIHIKMNLHKAISEAELKQLEHASDTEIVTIKCEQS